MRHPDESPKRIDSTPVADASADQTTRRKPKRSVLLKVRDDVAADADDSSSGFTVSKRKPFGGALTEYKLPSGNTGGHFYHSINGQLLTEQDLYGVNPEESQRNGVTTSHSLSPHETVTATWDVCGTQGTANLCEATKGQHAFIKLTDIETSGDANACSSQESANTNEASGDGEKDWSCSRCTYLNDPEHRICAICSSTRGIDVVERKTLWQSLREVYFTQ